MKTLYTTNFSLGEYVDVRLDNNTIRFCQITSVKFEEQGVKFDLLLSSGQKLYDVNYEAIASVAEAAINISKSEIENL